jgi:outer membrane murein-binding lipoprotein Lpp
LLAVCSLRIADRASGNFHQERHAYLLALNQSAASIPDFSKAHRLSNFSPADVEATSVDHARFDPLPSGINARWLKQVERAFVDYVYHYEVKTIWFNRTLKLYGRIGESRLAFRQRCEAAARQRRDAEATKLHDQFDRRMKALQDKIAREYRELEADRAELSSRKREELLSGVETLFNLLVGRRPSYAIAFGARRRREVETAAQDVRESEAAIAKLNADLEALAEEYKTALGQLNEKWARAPNDITELPITPKKSDIFVEQLAIAWVPLE